MKPTKPTYEELQKMLEYERSIKNSLYYFLTFKNLMQGYVVWSMVQGLDNMNQSTKKMDGFRRIHALVETSFTRSVVLKDAEYNINPN